MKRRRFTAWLAGWISLLALSQVGAEEKLNNGKERMDVPAIGAGLGLHTLSQTGIGLQRDKPIEKLKFPGLDINLEERCVDIEGKICLDKGMLELVACTQGSKEHESIVAIAARPMHIHAALLLLGAEAGSPAMRQAPRGEDERWIDIPPRGSPVDVLLVFPDKAGKPTEHPISEFIKRSSTESEVGHDMAAQKQVDSKFPSHTFLFAGSHLVDDGPGPRKYLSDDSGNVISIVTFGDELLCLSGVHSDRKDSLLWQVNAAGLPAVGTKVTLRLRPQTKPAVKATVRPL